MRFSEKLLSYFPTPGFLDIPHVGLDISLSSIRYIELTKLGGHLNIGRYGIQPVQNPISFDSSLVTNKELEDALKKIQKSENISFVEVSIPEVKSYLYTAEIPAGDEEGMRANIELHLEENVPLTLTESIFEYFIVSSNKKNGTVTVAVSVVPYQIIRDYITLLEKCSMTPVSFLVENQALSRAVVAHEDLSSYLLVHISEKRTVFSVVADHALQFTSSVQLGSDDFTNDLMREFKITIEEARKIKYSTENQDVVSEENKIFMSMINGFSTLKDEIARVHLYWQSLQDVNAGLGSEGSQNGQGGQNNQGKSKTPIKKIILSGRDAMLPGLQEYFSTGLNLPVDIANVWQNVFDLQKKVPEIEFGEALNFGTAIGLALPKNTY